MEIDPIEAKPLRIPPGRVGVRLNAGHRSAYRRLYSRAGTTEAGLPFLRDQDFDGRLVKLSQAEYEALDRAFASLRAEDNGPARNVFEAQERRNTRLFKRLQHLS